MNAAATEVTTFENLRHGDRFHLVSDRTRTESLPVALLAENGHGQMWAHFADRTAIGASRATKIVITHRATAVDRPLIRAARREMYGG